jgi:thiamine biosynthesis lipoprotein
VVRLWRRARRRDELPSPERIAEFKRSVGYRFVRIDRAKSSIELTKDGMWIDLGGIAKGYAIDEALAELRKQGISRALVDAGGDVGLGDSPPDRPSWTVGVAPLDPEADPSVLLSLSNVAVATSGDMWQYVEIDGRRYSHIVDPRTGLGLTDHSSVTVIAPDAITADGLASAVSVMGPKKGIELIDAMPNTAALIMRAPRGKIETYRSRRWSTVMAGGSR